MYLSILSLEETAFTLQPFESSPFIFFLSFHPHPTNRSYNAYAYIIMIIVLSQMTYNKSQLGRKRGTKRTSSSTKLGFAIASRTTILVLLLTFLLVNLPTSLAESVNDTVENEEYTILAQSKVRHYLFGDTTASCVIISIIIVKTSLEAKKNELKCECHFGFHFMILAVILL
jgi:hypothetical protein